MKNKILKILLIIIGFYVVLCGLLYFFQEKLIFFSQSLDKDYQFVFQEKFEEINITSTDGKLLNGLLFQTENSKGLIFYLHGNAGNLSSWGELAKTYTDLDYDIFILDYRSYGKSEGKINGQNQLFKDHQTVYDELKRRYDEEKIILLGYSIGTGFASKLASTNQPKLLILQAPYYSVTDIVKRKYPFVPTFLLKYKLTTHQYSQDCQIPVVIFHGTDDQVLYYGSSLKLKEEFKEQDTLITLHGQGHNGITENPVYKTALAKILATENQ